MEKNKSNALSKNSNNFINLNQLSYNKTQIEKDILPIPNLKNYINHIDNNNFPHKKYNKYSAQNISLNNNYSQDINDINEKNILLLNSKVKEQEKNIIYLKSRLQNYDITMNEITKLNIEINKLNDIINKKNKTIQEFRDLSDMSKLKIEELLKNNSELLQKIKILKEENDKLNKKCDKINEELFEAKNENNELKNKLKEKEKENEINGLKNNFIKNKNFIENKNLYLNYDNENNITENKGNETYDVNYYKINNRNRDYSALNGKLLHERRNMPLNMKRNYDFGISRKNNYLFNKEYSIRTDPSYNVSDNYDTLKKMYGSKNRYEYLNVNRKDLNPLNYSNY